MTEEIKSIDTNSEEKIAASKKARMKAQREKDNQMVRGKFRFLEIPGGLMEFVFKKYKGDPVRKYALQDGGIYTLPLMVAKHLNNNCWYPEYEYYKDSDLKDVTRMARKVNRCEFQSLEFVDIEGLEPQANLFVPEQGKIIK
jgi:hypothetical protein